MTSSGNQLHFVDRRGGERGQPVQQRSHEVGAKKPQLLQQQAGLWPAPHITACSASPSAPNVEALLLDASASMRTEFEGHLANLRSALEQAEQRRKLANDAINTLHVKIEELTKDAGAKIGERPKKSIFGGAEKLRRWDEAAAKKRLPAKQLVEQNKAREEAEKVRGEMDKQIKAVTGNIAKFERDLTLGVPEFAAIAYAGDASRLPGLGG